MGKTVTDRIAFNATLRDHETRHNARPHSRRGSSSGSAAAVAAGIGAARPSGTPGPAAPSIRPAALLGVHRLQSELSGRSAHWHPFSDPSLDTVRCLRPHTTDAALWRMRSSVTTRRTVRQAPAPPPRLFSRTASEKPPIDKPIFALP